MAKTKEQQMVDIVNAIRTEATSEYQERIPVATMMNISEVRTAMETWQPQANEFLTALMDKIALTTLRQKMAKNPLAVLKGEYLAFGTDIEEVFIEMAKSKVYDKDNENPFAKEHPDVKAMYHRVNRKALYEVTVYDEQLRGALTSYSALSRFTQGLINSVYSADKHDEFLECKNIFAQNIPAMKQIVVAKPIDSATAKGLLKAIKKASKDFTFVSSSFNAKGVKTLAESNEQVLVIHKDVSAEVDVEVLLTAFNQDKAKANVGQIIEVDDFGTGMDDVTAILMDKDAFILNDQLFRATQQRNERALYTNYFLHHWQLLSFSKFLNAVCFTAKAIPAV